MIPTCRRATSSSTTTPFLKQGEKRNNYRTLLWRAGTGAHFALFPNLNVNDPVWRKVMRDVRFRRALSLAIDRPLVNQVLYFGLAIEANNTVLPESPLFRERYQQRWAKYDRKAAQALLDEMGLKRGLDGVRRLPDGRPLEIIVETAGESSEQADVLELIRETWREVGIIVFTKPSQREVFRNRIFAGETLMSVWSGMENGIATPDMSPDGLAPTSQQQLQWPKWGQYYETSGRSGEKPDMPEAMELGRLNEAWRNSTSREERERIWHKMLEIHTEQQFVIGVVSGGAAARDPAQHADECPGESRLQLGSGRALRHPPAGHLLVQIGSKQTLRAHAELHDPPHPVHDSDAAGDQLRGLRDHPVAAGGLPFEPDCRAEEPG